MATGRADYLLYVDAKLVGVVEAKRVGVSLGTVDRQSERYASGLDANQRLAAWRAPLPFRYESTAVETRFTNGLDPIARPRRVLSFHQPITIARWMRDAESDMAAPTFRHRLRGMPTLIIEDLRPVQAEAITGLELSLAEDRPRALIQMATGAGKTFTMVTETYRLLRHARARRVLFLVDRNNLGRQAESEFENFKTPEDTVRRAVQRAAPAQRRRAGLHPRGDWHSAAAALDAARRRTARRRCLGRLPGYGKWRAVLEYFDAHLVGLTATPVAQTFGFFHENLVSQYTYRQAVADGVNFTPRALIDVRDTLAKPPGPEERATLVLANPPFGRKSGFTTVDEFGKVTREDVSYDRTDFWVTTSNKQLNFRSAHREHAQDRRQSRCGRPGQRAVRGRRRGDAVPPVAHGRRPRSSPRRSWRICKPLSTNSPPSQRRSSSQRLSGKGRPPPSDLLATLSGAEFCSCRVR